MQMEPKNIVMTLGQIRAFQPCPTGWNALIKHLKTSDDGAVVSLKTVLHNNGIYDAIWCFRVNWFEHKVLYMDFVGNCVKEAKHTATHDIFAVTATAIVTAAANAVAATNVVIAASAAAYASGAAIDIANYSTIKNRLEEQERQFQYLDSLLLY
jgi:hypothetical protein